MWCKANWDSEMRNGKVQFAQTFHFHVDTITIGRGIVRVWFAFVRGGDLSPGLAEAVASASAKLWVDAPPVNKPLGLRYDACKHIAVQIF